jgi:hypothetical protein
MRLDQTTPLVLTGACVDGRLRGHDDMDGRPVAAPYRIGRDAPTIVP